MKNLQKNVNQVFIEHFDSEPTHFIQAPGRVNLIGEHTDYNEGFVLPCAINFHMVVAAKQRDDNIVRIVAVDYECDSDEFTLSEKIPTSKKLWSNYIRGVLQFLHRRNYQFKGADLVLSSDIPQSAGLSSSAALEVAIGQTFNTLYDLKIKKDDIALNGQQAENEYVGCNCGIMDQLISAKGEKGHALLIDCRDLSTKSIKMPETHSIIIINSNEKRDLVDSKYNVRRLQCSGAAGQMHVASLRDATMTDLKQSPIPPDSDTYKRARHVITENERTLAMAKALESNDITQISHLMRASHLSMKNDFAITTDNIDFLVRTVDKALGTEGGVRMTGGGFGGCVVALVPNERVQEIAQLVANTYQAKTGIKENIYLCKVAAGTGQIN